MRVRRILKKNFAECGAAEIDKTGRWRKSDSCGGGIVDGGRFSSNFVQKEPVRHGGRGSLRGRGTG